MPVDAGGLEPRQRRFVDEYLIDLNATQAAIRAGYSEKTAGSIGSENLTKPEIASAIQAKQAERLKRVETSQDYVLTNLTEVVERTMQRAPVLEFDRDAKAYVQATDEKGNDIWTFDARNAVAALNLVGKHHGMFVDKHEIAGAGGGPIVVKIVREGKRPLK